MLFAKKWFSARQNKPTCQKKPAHPRTVQPRLEALEDRCVPTVTYHGGALLANVETQAVYFGSDYLTVANVAAQRNQLQGFVNYIAGSPYLDRLSAAGYNVAHGSNAP